MPTQPHEIPAIIAGNNEVVIADKGLRIYNGRAKAVLGTRAKALTGGPTILDPTAAIPLARQARDFKFGEDARKRLVAKHALLRLQADEARKEQPKS